MQFLDTVGLSDSVILSCVGIGPYMALSDGVHLKNDIDKVVTVYVNGKSITVHALYGARLDCMRVLWA